MKQSIDGAYPAQLFHFYDLKDRVFVLTGAANGIGRELAVGLAAQGCRLILVDRDEARLAELGKWLQTLRCDEKRSFDCLGCDLSRRSARERLARQIQNLAPTLDGVIHNAAIDPRGRLEDTSLDFFRHVMATNVEPALEITRDLLPNLRRSEAGRVVMIGSVTLEIGTAVLSSYVASKGALLGLTRSLAHELGADGITVNCIAPGAIAVEKETLRLEELRDDPGEENVTTRWQSVKRELVPEDLLGLLCLLLSRMGSGITGQSIQVDGGLHHPLAAPALQLTLIEDGARNDATSGISRVDTYAPLPV